MNSVASNASGVLSASDDELQHWQRVEAEAWGATPPEHPQVSTERPEEPPRSSSRPVAFVALLALVAFASLWLYSRQPSSPDAATAKAVVAPAVAREIPDTCSVLSDLRTVQTDAYVRLLGQDDPAQRLVILDEQSRAEVRLIDQLFEAEPSLTLSVAPMRFRAQLIVDGVGAVESGEQTLGQLLEAADEVAGQAADGDRAIAAFETEQCPAG